MDKMHLYENYEIKISYGIYWWCYRLCQSTLTYFYWMNNDSLILYKCDDTNEIPLSRNDPMPF